MTKTEVFYFGCESKRRTGHYLFSPGMRSVRQPPRDWPWDYGQLDGRYAPAGRNKDKEGIAALTYHKGWTVLAMWDQSADGRGNSNAAFAARGELEYAEMVGLASANFPEVWKRINERKRVVPLDAVNDEAAVVNAAKQFAATLADVRGRRGRDFIRAIDNGEAFDTKMGGT